MTANHSARVREARRGLLERVVASSVCGVWRRVWEGEGEGEGWRRRESEVGLVSRLFVDLAIFAVARALGFLSLAIAIGHL